MSERVYECVHVHVSVSVRVSVHVLNNATCGHHQGGWGERADGMENFLEVRALVETFWVAAGLAVPFAVEPKPTHRTAWWRNGMGWRGRNGAGHKSWFRIPWGDHHTLEWLSYPGVVMIRGHHTLG